METWSDVRAWRKETRAALIARRIALSRADREGVRRQICDRLIRAFPGLSTAVIGFYWPIKGEIDFRPLVGDLMAAGARAALPVIERQQAPLAFHAWRPGMKMGHGVWNIPIPAEPAPVAPTVLLVPLLGFDAAGYRLGYGGGYYDRTLASMIPKPATIGVGYGFGRLDTIHPQPHDIPLDAIVTENTEAIIDATALAALSTARGSATPAPVSTARGASPPCSQGDGDPAYAGYLATDEIVALLNELLEAERAGAKTVAAMAAAAEGEVAGILAPVAKDEARFCAMLSRHIVRLGGEPSGRTGDFHGKALAIDSPQERIDFLNRGQGWVVRKLQKNLARIADDALHADLADMLQVHEVNIERCSVTV